MFAFPFAFLPLVKQAAEDREGRCVLPGGFSRVVAFDDESRFLFLLAGQRVIFFWVMRKGGLGGGVCLYFGFGVEDVVLYPVVLRHADFRVQRWEVSGDLIWEDETRLIT